MIQTATAGQIKRIHGILSALKKQGVFSDLNEYKAILARQYSGGRTSSTKELNNYEAAELIGGIERLVAGQRPEPPKRSQETTLNDEQVASVAPDKSGCTIRHPQAGTRNDGQADVKRKRLFAMCHQMAWYLPGTRVVDKARLDGWCCKYGQFKKPLMAHTSAELSKIIVQMEKAFADYLRGSR
ncbi:hypothetical protein EBZ39_03565 [bacterium]|nr:hypothetical protein [bacterium]